MRIRRARETEATVLSELALSAKQVWGYSLVDIERWRSQLIISAEDITSKPTFIAEAENVVVGFYLLVPAARAWELDHLWVSPQYIRRGVGRALLAHASDTARISGASSITIDADPNAESFYVACGAIRQGVIAAPIAGYPDRIRPQLVLNIENQAA